MNCPNCGADTLSFAVPGDVRGLLRGTPDCLWVCTNCLLLEPTDERPEERPDFTRVSRVFPDDPERALPVVLAVALLDSLALNREAIVALVERAEQNGVDPLLVVDRLLAADVDPHFDLERRRTQLPQLLE